MHLRCSTVEACLRIHFGSAFNYDYLLTVQEPFQINICVHAIRADNGIILAVEVREA